jgi:lipopolysaccharide heptosyltransferase I
VIDGSPRILLIRLSAFGDCLHAVPVLVALRRHYPSAEIGWAIEDLSYSLLKDHPMVDRFHIFPRRAFKKSQGTFIDRMRSMRQFRKDLGGVKYDIAIDLQGLTKSGLVSWWSGAKRRIGFKGEDSREFNIIFNNERIEPSDEAVHVVEKNLSLLKPLGVKIPDKPEWVMPNYEAEFALIKPFLEKCGLINKDGGVGRFSIVNPGATWFTKRWPPELFGEVAKQLIARHDLPVVIPWAGSDEHKAAEVIAGIAGKRAFVAPDTDLRQLAALTSRAILFVGNDTGPLHLAVALNVHSVAIFGATDPLRNGPYGSMHRMQTGGVDCHPCWKTTCERKDRACLTWVTPETVLTSCAHVLKRKENEAGTAAAC